MHLETVGAKGADDCIGTLDALRNGALVLQVADNNFDPSRERREFLCVARIDRQGVALLQGFLDDVRSGRPGCTE